MIPMIGLMIWAYGMARLLELIDRKREREVHWGIGLMIIFLMLVMCYSCTNLMLSSFKTPTGLIP